MSEAAPRRRCLWSSKVDSRVRQVTVTVRDRWGRNPHPESLWVLPEHERELRDFCAASVRWGPLFIGLLAFSMLVLAAGSIAGYLLRSEWLALGASAGSLLLVGGLILVLPFSTPETVELVGIARSRVIARVAGVVTLLMGVGLLALGTLL